MCFHIFTKVSSLLILGWVKEYPAGLEPPAMARKLRVLLPSKNAEIILKKLFYTN